MTKNAPLSTIYFQFLFQILSSKTLLALSHFLWSACRHETSATIAALRTEVDNVVGTFDDLQIVLNDEDGMASADECIESL